MSVTRKKNIENGKNTTGEKRIEASNKKQEPRNVTTWEMLNIIFELLTEPILTIGFHVVCNEKQCSFTSLPDLSQFTSLSSFFDMEALLYYVGYYNLIVLLSFIPIGGERIRVKDHTYNLNGFFTMLLLVFIFLVLEIIGVPVSHYIVGHVMHLIVAATIYQMFMGIFLYVYSFFTPQYPLNPREIGTPWICGFYYGRQVNPRFFNKVDFKFLFMKILLGWLVISDFALLLQTLNLSNEKGLNLANFNWKSLSSHPTLVVLVILHSTYSLYHLYYESRTLSSYHIQEEGCGYNILMANSFRWSGLVAQTKYFKDHNVHYPNWQLLSLLSIFLFAQYVYNVTNNQKDNFRRYPNSPESKKMKRIPTSTGKDILCEGWWGRLRQPNIMADIVIHLTWIRFGFTAPPVLSVIGLFYYLFDRARTSQNDCKIKYGLAWQKYCKKVKYVLVPFVY